MLIALTKDLQENTRERPKRSDENSVGGRALKKLELKKCCHRKQCLK